MNGMTMNNMTYSKHIATFSGLALASIGFLLTTGCKKPVDDATLTTNVQAALAADSTLGSNKPIQVATQNGVVTLEGNVTDETASSVAAQDTAKVSGVKMVVNSLAVAGLAVAPTVTTASEPTVARRATRQERVAIAQHQALPPPPPSAPAAPKVVYQDVSVDAGTSIPFRITEGLSSETTQPGTPINGVITRDVIVNGYVAIPAGSSASGTVTDAKDATHFKGSSELAVQLTSIRRHGNLISISTEPYVVEGKGRGTNTAEKIGGGAAVGAVLGGIFGGGRGAAIGAGAGAGGGTILQGATRGQQVAIPSETVIRFRLANSFTVHTADLAGDAEPDSPGLQQR